MRLNHSIQLADGTLVPPGGTWPETFQALQTHALAVRERVCPHKPFALGLSLSERAAVELGERGALLDFHRWLDKHGCYVFTLNGSLYGQYHRPPAKEQVHRPDWTSPERAAYTNLLFNLLAELLPAGGTGSVSTLPGSFKEFHPDPSALRAIRQNLWHSVEHVARVGEKTGRQLQLALEPGPLCLLESTAETLHAFDHLRAEHPHDPRLAEHLGVNYNCGHFAVEFEEPQNALACLVNHGIKISKIQLSSALKVIPTPAACAELKKHADGAWLRQVVARDETGQRTIFRDLPDALAFASRQMDLDRPSWPEWRIHFHLPRYAPAAPPFENTNDHLLGILDLLAENPGLCAHLETETDTWEMLPPELQAQAAVDRQAQEYEWILAQLAQRGLAGSAPGSRSNKC